MSRKTVRHEVPKRFAVFEKLLSNFSIIDKICACFWFPIRIVFDSISIFSYTRNSSSNILNHWQLPFILFSPSFHSYYMIPGFTHETCRYSISNNSSVCQFDNCRLISELNTTKFSSFITRLFPCRHVLEILLRKVLVAQGSECKVKGLSVLLYISGHCTTISIYLAES